MSDTKRLEDAVADLVRQALAGDDAAREELLRRCHGTVYRWALVHTGDADDADDVAQEVLVRLYTRLERYSARARFTTWLYQVTRNAALELRRRWARRLRLRRSLAGQSDAERSEAEDPLKGLHAAGIAGRLAPLFHELPRRQREVFFLADLAGHSPAEIAERLAMNPVTVRAHLHRARRTLRARILERYPDLAEETER